jgi:hypothetical protein
MALPSPRLLLLLHAPTAVPGGREAWAWAAVVRAAVDGDGAQQRFLGPQQLA